MKILLSLLLFLTLILSFNLHAKEVITSYHSDINIQQNGQLHIIETIQVRAENNQIKRGIYRDFPTLYKDKSGISKVGFTLISVQRDGVKEDYHTSKLSNGIRIYIGNRDVILKPGHYSYQIEFTTTHQLGFFNEYDELYFNVTGNGWNFPIQQASAIVTLPEAVESSHISLTGYTGIKGSTQQFLTHQILHSGQFNFTTTQLLKAHEGLTIVANWPKGIITEPDAGQLRALYIENNKHSLIAVSGLALVLIYYVFIWLKVGKDPDKGIILPLYQAPEGFSPASTRFISQMSYDKSCFTVALVNLAIKGFISIDQNSSKNFIIHKLYSPATHLAAGESAILQQLFESSDQITLTQSEHKRLRKALNNHETSLREDYEKLHFNTNKKFFFPGMLISLATIIFSILTLPDEAMTISTIAVSIISFIPFVIIVKLFRSYLKKGKQPSLIGLAIQIVSFGILALVLSDLISSLHFMLEDISWPVAVSIYLMIAANIMFEQWLKAPTLAGRKLLDKIESFKLYLSIAEEDELKLSGQPEFSNDIYQQFLPYAIALGVNHSWSKKLERSIDSGLIEKGVHPTGFLYHNNYHDMNDFTSSISTGLDSAISSSSTAPGSSSGSVG
ncbi:MAG: DUF2207 domain-containing protein, partial [Gammaproteobacteria bacterium]|nr:DUF2207 domain-containing protein [Gammaproteobacteria bacterium]